MMTNLLNARLWYRDSFLGSGKGIFRLFSVHTAYPIYQRPVYCFREWGYKWNVFDFGVL